MREADTFDSIIYYGSGSLLHASCGFGGGRVYIKASNIALQGDSVISANANLSPKETCDQTGTGGVVMIVADSLDIDMTRSYKNRSFFQCRGGESSSKMNPYKAGSGGRIYIDVLNMQYMKEVLLYADTSSSTSSTFQDYS